MSGPVDIADPQPMTVKGFLRSIGVPLGGAVRSRVSRAIDDALFAVWTNACELYDGETAAVMLFAMLSYDPHYRPPLWLSRRFAAHRAGIETAVQNGTVRQIRWSLERW